MAGLERLNEDIVDIKNKILLIPYPLPIFVSDNENNYANNNNTNAQFFCISDSKRVLRLTSLRNLQKPAPPVLAAPPPATQLDHAKLEKLHLKLEREQALHQKTKEHAVDFFPFSFFFYDAIQYHMMGEGGGVSHGDVWVC